MGSLDPPDAPEALPVLSAGSQAPPGLLTAVMESHFRTASFILPNLLPEFAADRAGFRRIGFDPEIAAAPPLRQFSQSGTSPPIGMAIDKAKFHQIGLPYHLSIIDCHTVGDYSVTQRHFHVGASGLRLLVVGHQLALRFRQNAFPQKLRDLATRRGKGRSHVGLLPEVEMRCLWGFRSIYRFFYRFFQRFTLRCADSQLVGRAPGASWQPAIPPPALLNHDFKTDDPLLMLAYYEILY